MATSTSMIRTPLAPAVTVLDHTGCMRLRTPATKLIALGVLLTLAACSTGIHHAPTGRVTENAQEPAISPSRRTQEFVPPWRLSGPVADDDELAGYTTSESVLPGEPIQLKVDSPRSAVEIQVLRMGFYGIDGARTVAHLPWQEGVAQPPCSMGPDRMVDCSAWSVTHSVETRGWEPGLYLMKMHNRLDHWRYVPIVVRSPENRGSVTFVSATATWQAYNTFGGYSLYHGPDPRLEEDRAFRVSFNRPYAAEGAGNALQYEVGLIQLLEKLGVPISYTTSQRLETDPSSLTGTRAVVFSGHDEYWTPEMRGTVEGLRDDGVNLLFLGANTMYWRIRWEDGGRVVVAYKRAALDPVQGAGTTELFRYPPDPRPESRLLGAQYACLGTYQDMTIVEESFWAFQGTGAARNQTYPRLVGGEVDAVTTHSPSGTQVVAHSPYRCTDGSGSAADVTYYTAPSGAGVFNAGTFGWTNALTYGTTAPAESIIFVEHVVSTLVKEAAIGPLGLRHPSEPNVDRYLPR